MLKFFSFGCKIVFYVSVTPSSSINTKRDILHSAKPAVVSALCASLRNCQNCVEDFSTKIKEIHQEKRGRGRRGNRSTLNCQANSELLTRCFPLAHLSKHGA